MEQVPQGTLDPHGPLPVRRSPARRVRRRLSAAKLLNRSHFNQLHSDSTGLSIGAYGGNLSRSSRSAKWLIQVADRVALVHRATVPDDHEPPGQVLQHRLQEGRHVPVVEVAVGQGVEVKPQPIAARRQPHGRRDRDLLAGRRSSAPVRESGPRGAKVRRSQRGHQQAALVDQGDVGTLPPGFFLDARPVGLQPCGDHLRVALAGDAVAASAG